ncbi:MAG: hypothetical protein IT406_00140, partial [Candidatus Yanofskybacteria bacterium]|nr:hypothetical protein [Candidatus Yanofskybacteria bacterium]
MKSSAEWPIHTQTTSPAEHKQLARERAFGAYQEGVEDRVWDAQSAYEEARAAYRTGQGSAEALHAAEAELERAYDEELERLEHASGLEPVEIARVRDWLGRRVHQAHSLEHDKEFTSYESEVVMLLEGVANLESYAELLEKKGALSRDVREDLHEQVNRFYEQLEELDERRTDTRPSREREQLVALLQRIHDRYPLVERAPVAPSLSRVRALHRSVRANYAAIQHDLPLEQRQSLRSRIALLSGLVRQAEDARYRELFRHPPRFRVHAAIERATEYAPALA